MGGGGGGGGAWGANDAIIQSKRIADYGNYHRVSEQRCGEEK